MQQTLLIVGDIVWLAIVAMGCSSELDRRNIRETCRWLYATVAVGRKGRCLDFVRASKNENSEEKKKKGL